jgi:hypothetical protein
VEALGFILLTVLLAGLMMVLIAVVGVVLSARAVGKRNRVSPDVASPAPKSWVSKPSAPARLHRRLRAAVSVARAATASAPSAPRLAELAAELEREAVALDMQLVIVDNLVSKDRRAQLAALSSKVMEVERIASSLSVQAVQAQAPMLPTGEPSALDKLAHELDALEAARTEVSEIESAAGLHRPSPYTQGTPSPGSTSPPAARRT